MLARRGRCLIANRKMKVKELVTSFSPSHVRSRRKDGTGYVRSFVATFSKTGRRSVVVVVVVV